MFVRLSALALLELRVLLVDDVQTALAANQFAINRAFLYRGPDLHLSFVFSVGPCPQVL
jgi:hypothetical protein